MVKFLLNGKVCSIDEDESLIEFLRINRINLYEILEKREILKKLIKYLKNEKEIKYVDIMNHFEINKGVMQNLKK